MTVPQPDDRRPGPSEHYANEEPTEALPAADRPESQMLEGVLRQTLSLLGSERPLSEETSQALCRLVARHKGTPFALEPIVVELVAIVLRTQLPQGPGAPELCNGVASRVARTLYDDPTSRRRLEAFWNHLSGG